MKIYPAIDLLQGHCVRLAQGDFNAVTAYDADPMEVAQAYRAGGAECLHIVDLDGARGGRPAQTDVIERLLKLGMRTQVGGGIRTLEQAQQLIQAGAERVILGSIAVKDPATAQAFLMALGGERVTLALDVRVEQGTPKVALHGWQENSSQTLWQTIERYLELGLRHVLCTDIARDGMLQGPNDALYEALQKRFPGIAVQASGGVGTLDDLRRLKALGVAGAIVGKALYERRFTLAEALAC